MRKDKPDINKASIVADLRSRGFVWVDIGGAVDGVAIGHSHITETVAAVLVEIKAPGRKIVFTDSESKLQKVLADKGYHHAYLVAQDVTDILRWFGCL